MRNYKGVNYWYNGLQEKYFVQIGYEIIAICNTEQGAKRAITWYLKD